MRANIRVKEGDTYTRAGVDDDVRTLYAHRLFLQHPRGGRAQRRDGIDLLYRGPGQAEADGHQLRGNKKYSNGKLSKKVTSKIGEPLDERKTLHG